MTGAPAHFWLWLLTVATAVAGGALSIWGTSLQRREASHSGSGRTGYRVVMASYVLMSISIGVFVIRGFI